MAGHNREPDEMHRDVSWMKPSDYPVMREFAALDDRWQKPSTLSLNISYSRYTVADRCRELTKRGLLERHPDTAGYRITEKGHAFLNGELEVDDLRDNP